MRQDKHRLTVWDIRNCMNLADARDISVIAHALVAILQKLDWEADAQRRDQEWINHHATVRMIALLLFMMAHGLKGDALEEKLGEEQASAIHDCLALIKKSLEK